MGLRGLWHRPHGRSSVSLAAFTARSFHHRRAARRRWVGHRVAAQLSALGRLASFATATAKLMLGAADGDACLSKPAPAPLCAPLEISPALLPRTAQNRFLPVQLRSRDVPFKGSECRAHAQVVKLLHQQAAIAGFGSFALRQNDLLKVLTEAARVCADGLSVPFSKVCRYRETENDLLIEAGYGWNAGVVGHVVSRADSTSPQGRAFITGQPSICNDLRADNDYELPPFYGDHGIISTIDVVIKGNGHPYGVLEIDSDKQCDYDEHDVNFLTGFANVLAEAVATSQRLSILQANNEQMTGLVERMKSLVDDKDRLLSQKNVLAEELQHRVRNNLQLVYGMLGKHLEETPDRHGQRGIRAIARRVTTLAQVYDHLLGSEMTRTTDFQLRAVAVSQPRGDPGLAGWRISLTCESDSIILDLDVVTALGLIVAELVTNSYDHAFPGGRGSIKVSVRRDTGNSAAATMTIRDSGTGFTAQPTGKRHGLGLVRRLVEQIDGSVLLESARGTVWTIQFPTTIEAAAAA